MCELNDDGSVANDEKYIWYQGRAIWVYSFLHNHFGKNAAFSRRRRENPRLHGPAHVRRRGHVGRKGQPRRKGSRGRGQTGLRLALRRLRAGPALLSPPATPKDPGSWPKKASTRRWRPTTTPAIPTPIPRNTRPWNCRSHGFRSQGHSMVFGVDPIGVARRPRRRRVGAAPAAARRARLRPASGMPTTESSTSFFGTTTPGIPGAETYMFAGHYSGDNVDRPARSLAHEGPPLV